MKRTGPIGVVCGGAGSERDVSLRSGKAVCDALIQASEQAVLIDLPTLGPRLDPRLGEIELAFLALHGGWGEDGRLQQRLERAQIPFLGSGPESSRLAMHKHASKEAMRAAGVPTPDSAMVLADDAWRVDRLIADLGLPLFVKPEDDGSSFGVSRVSSAAALESALAALTGGGRDVLVEQAIRGREFTVGIVDGQPLPLVEIVTGRDFFDTQAKYQDTTTRYYLDHGLPEPVVREIQEVALAAYRVHGARHLARIDIMHDGQKSWVLELNSLPGMTERSLLPKAALAAGMTFPELCRHLVACVRRDFGLVGAEAQGVA